MRKRRAEPLAIVATTPDDSHGWNLVGVQLELEARGFEVVNLGPCTPVELLAEEIRDRRPDLVALSTINGHGAASLPIVLEALGRYQVQRTAPIVIGGLLTTCPERQRQAELALTALGITAVFTGDDAWPRFDWFLRSGSAAFPRSPGAPQAARPFRRASARSQGLGRVRA